MFLIGKARKHFTVATEPVSIANNDGVADGVNASLTPLSDIADAFEELAPVVDSDYLQLSTFCHACSYVSVLFGCLGLAFKFAELEYVAKVKNLTEASSRFTTLHDILDLDAANNTVKVHGSYSRNLRRVRLGLDLIRALFEQFLTSDHYCLREAASTAYAEVCAPYHTWTVRTAVSAGMYALPTREQLLIKLNETEQSAEMKMRRYIKASIPVISYIDNLYISRNITLDW
ncbi:unnamed protein product [Rhodiola kirilowii]